MKNRDYPAEIRAARAYLKFNQKKMAEFLEVSEKTIQNWESGRTLPPADKWEKIKAIQN